MQTHSFRRREAVTVTTIRWGGLAVPALDRVDDIARKLAAAAGFHLLAVDQSPGRGRQLLRVTLDRPGGITLKDCEAFSRRLEQVLDADEVIAGRYTLEVASPGLDRVLKSEAELAYFAGRDVKVTARTPVAGRRRWVGRLEGLAAGQVVLVGPAGEQWSIPFDQTVRVQLQPDLSPRQRGAAGRKHGGREH